MNSNSDEVSESEISESEIDDYSKKPYQQLKSGEYSVKVRDMFKCPFCSGKKKQHYKYKELLAHASGVAKGSASRSPKLKAKHLALAKYLKNELAGDAEVPRSKISSPSSKQSQANVNDVYVWPWMGIVINPVRINDNKNLLLDRNYWLKKLAKYNPLDVETLWVEQDSVVAVIPKFDSGWSGFKSASELENDYEVKRCGKKDWCEKGGDWRSKTYGWCASADDYNAQGSIAEYLSKVGELKSFSVISKEEKGNTNTKVDVLATQIARTNEDLNVVQYKYKEKAFSLHRVLEEKEALDKAYKEESQKMQVASRDNVRRILKKKDELNKQLQNKMGELKKKSEELDRKEAVTELERQKLDEEKKKSDDMNRSLQLASQVQKENDDSVLRLVEEHKRQKEETLNKILQLQEELNSKQKLQMEIQELKGKLQVMKRVQVMKSVEDEDDEEDIKEKIKKLSEELEEKCSELEDLEDTNSTLMIKERQSNDEIQEAREVLITGLRELLSDRTLIRIKRMGELDEKPFVKACKERFTEEEAAVQQAMLCSGWQENLKDPAWHPYKNVGTEDSMKEVVDEEDEKLWSLREEWGEEVMNAVKTALEELSEFNPSGRYSVPVLWNVKGERKATLKEVITYMTKQIKFLKGKRKII